MITAETKVYRLMGRRSVRSRSRRRTFLVGKFLRADVVIDRPDKGSAIKKVEWI